MPMAQEGQRPLRVIGIGASAGGVDALTRLVADLPADLPHAILVVLHLPSGGRSLLARILDRASTLPVTTAQDGDALAPGHIFVAPPDRHLLLRDGVLELSRGPKENAARPAVDPLLRSIARVAGRRGVAVILSGALGDGSSGALALARAGGTVIVQDPEDALVASMPQRALEAVAEHVHLVAPIRELGRLLGDLPDVGLPMREDVGMGSAGDAVEASRQRPEGPATGFTCPECSGALWELREGDLVRYRCRVGHAYSEDAMLTEQGHSVEAALWAALEVLEERAELLQRIAGRSAATHPRTRRRLEEGASDALARAELIRRALSGGSKPDAFALADDGGLA